MMAYNFLFFYPILFLAAICSTIVLWFAFSSFQNRPITNSILALSTIPTLLSLTLVCYHLSIKDYSYTEPTEIFNGSVEIKIQENLSLKLTGYSYEQSRKKVTLIPEGLDAKKYTEHNFYQGDYSSFFLYYKADNDSIYTYVPDGLVLYYINDDLNKLPIRTFQVPVDKDDSLALEAEKQTIISSVGNELP